MVAFTAHPKREYAPSIELPQQTCAVSTHWPQQGTGSLAGATENWAGGAGGWRGGGTHTPKYDMMPYAATGGGRCCEMFRNSEATTGLALCVLHGD